MYTFTRQEVAEKLNISTRSVDRYIKSWKLRSKKDWKIVYVNDDDVKNMLWEWEKKQEVIINKKVKVEEKTKEIKTTKTNENQASTLWFIYKDLKEEIQKKDQLIQTLAMRVWKSEEVAKNSVSLIDFKKSQFLLEESKQSLNDELVNLKKEKWTLIWELKYEKTTNILLIVFVVVLLAIVWLVWFFKI
jgi:hypothetical protein